MFSQIPPKVQNAIRVFLTVLVLGGSYAVNNKAAIIMAVAVLLTYACKWVGSSFGWKPSRGVLTGFLFLVSLGLAIAFEPNLVPVLVLPADSTQNGAVFILYLSQLAGAATPIVGAATLIYNLLVKDISDNLLPDAGDAAPPAALVG